MTEQRLNCPKLGQLDWRPTKEAQALKNLGAPKKQQAKVKLSGN